MRCREELEEEIQLFRTGKSSRQMNILSSPTRGLAPNLLCKGGSATYIGRRQTNQDVPVILENFTTTEFMGAEVPLSYYALFDGHGSTASAAQKASAIMHKCIMFQHSFPADPKEFFSRGYAFTDRRILMDPKTSLCGTTATTAIVYRNTLFVANVGDTEMILVSADMSGRHPQGTVLTERHRADIPRETQRIKEAGGCVAGGRLEGTLQLSRGLGDIEFKPRGRLPLLSCEPHVIVRKLTPNEDRLAIMASDGLWEVVSMDEAMIIACDCFSKGFHPQATAQTLIDVAITRGAPDNVTVIVIFFGW